MEIKGLHLLLTYQCNFACDHCFVWGSPEASGVMTLSDIFEILGEAEKMGTVQRIYFEGGEPFLYYPIMLRGLKEAKARGFETGVVTNAYWAISKEDAVEWLKQIAEASVADLSISDDAFHYDEGYDNGKHATAAAKELAVPSGTISIHDPKERLEPVEWRGKPLTGGQVMFKGRAAEKLSEGLPRKPWSEFRKCSHEDFANQSRVHIDPFGYVHLCQGIVMGNCKEVPLSKLVRDFDPVVHPICGPILEGGPAELVRKYGVPHDSTYVDECHLCYAARVALRERFPDHLAPDQMYGVGLSG